MSDILHTIIRVRGARYYEAQAALDGGELREGSLLRLEPEPNNKHDSNAVAIYTYKKKMLGHIARDIAEKYQKLCFQNQIDSVHVASAKKTDDFLKFDIRVKISYWSNIKNRVPVEEIAPQKEDVSEKAGVYELSCGADRVYIGASGNLRQRKKTHLSNLLRKTHPNNLIQRDFIAFGEQAFRFRVIKLANSLADAEKLEADEIYQRLLRGEDLYNKTADGKGVLPTSAGEKSVSDVYQKWGKPGANGEGKAPSSSPVTEPEKIVRRPRSERVEKEPQSNPASTTVAKLLVDDAEYEGETFGGKAHGKGKITWLNGDSYFGQFEMNKRTGKGVFYWRDGKKYEGEFVDGEITGSGKFLWPNGDQLEGRFLNGRRLPGAKFTRGINR
jgi:hypothetical protein